jgi:hypothetical protein
MMTRRQTRNQIAMQSTQTVKQERGAALQQRPQIAVAERLVVLCIAKFAQAKT